MYRDIANIDTLDKMLEFIKNTESIYGDIPLELVNLIKIAYIKNMCSLIGVSKIIIKDKVIIYLESKEDLTKNLLDISFDNYKDNVNLSLSTTPSIEITGINENEMLEFLINYLQLITNN